MNHFFGPLIGSIQFDMSEVRLDRTFTYNAGQEIAIASMLVANSAKSTK